MRTGNLKINDRRRLIQSLVKQSRRIFYKLGKGAIHFGESLFIFALHHDLSLRLEGVKAEQLQRFDAELSTLLNFDTDSRSAPLRMGNAVYVTAVPRVLGKFRGTRAG